MNRLWLANRNVRLGWPSTVRQGDLFPTPLLPKGEGRRAGVQPTDGMKFALPYLSFGCETELQLDDYNDDMKRETAL